MEMKSYVMWPSEMKLAFVLMLKGLGHAILGNFSTDQMVIELTKLIFNIFF